MLGCAFLADLCYSPGPVSPAAAAGLIALLILRLCACLEAYTLLTFPPPWKYAVAAYWPIVAMSFGLTIAVAAQTGFQADFVFMKRYVQIWQTLFMLFAVLFAIFHREPDTPWKPVYAVLLSASMALQALGSLLSMMGISGEDWKRIDAQLYYSQAAILGSISCVALKAGQSSNSRHRTG